MRRPPPGPAGPSHRRPPPPLRRRSPRRRRQPTPGRGERDGGRGASATANSASGLRNEKPPGENRAVFVSSKSIRHDDAWAPARKSQFRRSGDAPLDLRDKVKRILPGAAGGPLLAVPEFYVGAIVQTKIHNWSARYRANMLGARGFRGGGKGRIGQRYIGGNAERDCYCDRGQFRERRHLKLHVKFVRARRGPDDAD